MLTQLEGFTKTKIEESVVAAASGPSPADDDDDDDEQLCANEKLQVILRRSLEYSAAHQLSGQQFESQHLILSFLTLISATACSLLLFTSSNQSNEKASSASDTNMFGATWGSFAANITALLTIIKDAANLSSQASRQREYLTHLFTGLSIFDQTDCGRQRGGAQEPPHTFQIRYNSSSLPLPKLMDFFLKPHEPRLDANKDLWRR